MESAETPKNQSDQERNGLSLGINQGGSIETTAIPMLLCLNREIKTGLSIAKKMQKAAWTRAKKPLDQVLMLKREFIMDSFASMHMMSKVDFSPEE